MTKTKIAAFCLRESSEIVNRADLFIKCSQNLVTETETEPLYKISIIGRVYYDTAW